MAHRANNTFDPAIDALKKNADDYERAIKAHFEQHKSLFKRKKDEVERHDDGADFSARADASYQHIRTRSPSTAARNKLKDKEHAKPDGIPYADKVNDTNWHADHVFPAKKMPELPGFTELSRTQQVELANDLNNLVRHWGPGNTSRQDKLADTWTGHSKHPLSDVELAALRVQELKAELYLRTRITDLLKDQG